jgi:hypothetical protein
MHTSELTPERGAVEIKLDRPRILFFSNVSTMLLVEKYGIGFLRELYGVTPRGNDIVLELKSLDALEYFTWAGLQDQARELGETVTLKQVHDLIPPAAIERVFNKVFQALTRTVYTPAAPKAMGKEEAAAPAEKPTAKKRPAKKGSTLRMRRGLRLER